MRQPACESADPEIFFPREADRPSANREAYKTAKVYCDTCPVRELCLRMALDHERGRSSGHVYGMFGGLTPAQRRRILAGETRECQECGASIAHLPGNARYCGEGCRSTTVRRQHREYDAKRRQAKRDALEVS